MIEKLASSKQVQTPVGPIVVTHRMHGYAVQPWNDPPMSSFVVLGTVHPVSGKFIPTPHSAEDPTEETVHFTAAEFAALEAPSGSKKAGVFRTDDVRALHEKKAAGFPNRPSTLAITPLPATV